MVGHFLKTGSTFWPIPHILNHSTSKKEVAVAFDVEAILLNWTLDFKFSISLGYARKFFKMLIPLSW